MGQTLHQFRKFFLYFLFNVCIVFHLGKQCFGSLKLSWKQNKKKQKKRECKKKFNQWLTQRLKGNVSAWITKQTKERVGGRENVSMQCLNIIPLSRAASISFVKSASLPASEVFNWTNHFKKKKNLQETQCVLRHNQAHGHNEMFSFTKLNRPYTHRYVYAPFTGQKFSSL